MQYNSKRHQKFSSLLHSTYEQKFVSSQLELKKNSIRCQFQYTSMMRDVNYRNFTRSIKIEIWVHIQRLIWFKRRGAKNSRRIFFHTSACWCEKLLQIWQMLMVIYLRRTMDEKHALSSGPWIVTLQHATTRYLLRLKALKSNETKIYKQHKSPLRCSCCFFGASASHCK